MVSQEIFVEDASQNNLKNINVRILRNNLVVFTGFSESGCRARTFYLTGDWMACDPWCPLTRGVTEEDLKVARGDLDAI